jgi:phosphate/sulfate permease
MDINCDKIVEKYLLIQNPLYTFSFPISILIAIIFFGIAKAYNFSDNSYINQIFIPILALLISLTVIDVISKLMINQEDKIKLIQLCKIWMHDPNTKANPNKKINMDEIVNYDKPQNNIRSSKKISEVFSNMNNKLAVNYNVTSNNTVESLIDEIPKMSPFPLESKPVGNMCIENSNGCNLCSGSNQNPDNIISPIPGPQWLPQNAEYVQNRLVNNDYTASVCPIK